MFRIGIFKECNLVEYLDLSNFITSNVYNMSGMFRICNILKEIKGLNKFNTNQVTNLSEMFGICNEIEYLDL